MGNTPSHSTPNPSGHATPAPASPTAKTSEPKDPNQPPQTPLLLPHAGHYSAQNPHALSHPQTHDFNRLVVSKLILEERLAPFYRGLEDFEEDWTEEDVWERLAEVRERDFEENVANTWVARAKLEREETVTGAVKRAIVKDKGDREERERREKKAYIGATECPICFLVSRNHPIVFTVPGDGLALMRRTTHPTSTPRDAANNRFVPNASSRSSAPNRPSRISTPNPHHVHSASRPTSA